MKVNPIGIQTYQQLNKRDSQPTGIVEQQQSAKIPDKKVTISPQKEVSPSKLSIKAKTEDYSKFLSPEEKNVLDILFAQYKETGRFGPGYRGDLNQTETGKSIGRTIDIKV